MISVTELLGSWVIGVDRLLDPLLLQEPGVEVEIDLRWTRDRSEMVKAQNMIGHHRA